MGTLYWRGDAQAIAQVDHFTPANVEIGDTFSITINGKTLAFTATAATVANVVAGLVALIGQYDNDIPEFAEVSASSGTDSDGNVTHLILTGPTDGKPFTATAGTADAGNLSVTVTTLVEGSAAQNEKQVITLRRTPSGGTFTLTFDGETTSAIDYDAPATGVGGVQTILEALSNIIPGDAVVTGDAGGPWTVEFLGSYLATNVPLMSGNGASLTGAATVSIETLTQGSPGGNELQRLNVTNLYAESVYRILWQRPNSTTLTTSWLPRGATAAQIQAALEANAKDAGGFSVVEISSYTFNIYFLNQYGSQNVNEITSEVIGAGDTVIATITEGSATGVDEVQVVTLLGGPTGGTFTLTFQGQTTAGIAYNAAASAVKSALEAISTITTVSVTGNAGGPWTITFEDPGDQDVSQMTGSGASLTGCAVDVTVGQEAASAVDEQQQVSIDSSAGGGTFTLTWDFGSGDETTAGIAYNAAASAVQSAIVALTTPVSGDVSVTGPDGGPYVITFTSNLGATDIADGTGDGSSLTGGGTQTLSKSSDTTPSGPNWWIAANFDTGALPVNSDVVIFENNDVDCLYGLDTPSSVTLTALHLRASYTGRLGLPTHTGLYWEYRETELTLAGITSLLVGEGDGAGANRIKINGGSGQSTVIVRATGSSEDDTPAMQWRGTHASNAVRVYRGDVGIGTEQYSQAATVTTLDVGQQGGGDSDATVTVGSGVTLTTVSKLSGQASINCAATTVKQYGGGLDLLGTAAYTTLTIQEGTCTYRSSGTVTTLTIGSEGSIDYTQDMRSRTVTNCTLEAGATLDDSWGTVTFTNPMTLSNCDVEDVTLRLGRNRTLQVA